MLSMEWKQRAKSRSWTLRPARAGDLDAVRELLTTCELPLGGLDDQFGEHYVVAEKDNTIIGVAGVESHGTDGLLRSVAVAPVLRGSGIARELVDDRIAWAKSHGLESIYLLTMTAESYFTRHGFVVAERGSAPTAIRRSHEFSELCQNATFMRLSGDSFAADDPEAIRRHVREYYGRAATEASSGKAACCGGSCGNETAITTNLYEAHELDGIPEDALRASLGCGNPTLLAELREGETVLDLGSGGGIDVLLSARRVGPRGKAYGIDMTDAMLDLARENQRKAGVPNVEFLKGEIEHMPLPDASVDVIISNCVINLSADKPRVIEEAFRVLKPGGRFAVSDVVVRRDIPAEVRRNAELWAGCIAGALEEWTYRGLLREAGFEDVEVVPTRIYSAEDAGVAGSDLDGAFMSAFIRARKPS